MYKHFLIITPYHKSGHRIAWHKILSSKDDFSKANSVLERLMKKTGDLNVATHIITTDSKHPDSIVKKDKFFEDVAFYTDEESFIEQYKEELELTANDIAKFILSRYNTITHLKLQKLIYLCYEDFMRKTGVPLFKDEIYAFPLGPVIMNVYNKYTGGQKEYIELEEDDSVFLGSIMTNTRPSFSKILFSEVGIAALESITETLAENIRVPAYDLVEKTHQKGSPWRKIYKKGVPAKIIPVEVIRESIYH
ncbi:MULTISPECIES: Panacea domain-containing protein [Staphylococcaceae]|uniref:Panacea domain-containing protein n=1 Tax=Staphylococcaceae TaxID=90964 RepID=UPI000C31F800|nr:type II toxin-antitoxin system antitoxin SocA domain-containing protein [Macrococcus caseolyticus]PKE22794.1 hypothetical protein CW688_01300 [Macrococcus caseolyticus]